KSQGPSLGREITNLNNGDLVLFRKRISALMAAQFHKGPVRLRLPGYPAAVFAWVGLVFSEWPELQISATQFEERWKQKVPKDLSQGWTVDNAWALLLQEARAPKERVDVRKLRGLTARSRPPVELCHPDYGDSGPIFSTIHASKGREADRVFLMLPNDLDYLNKGDIDPAEEARVYYVGATRVKKDFFHGVARAMVTGCKLDSAPGRVASTPFDRKVKPGIQFGLAGDIDDAACISQEWCLCASEKAALENQGNLITLWRNHAAGNEPVEVTAKNEKLVIGNKEVYRYRLLCGGKTIGWTGEPLNMDLWKTAQLTKTKTKVICGMRPPDEMEHLRLTGLRTCAIPLDPAAEGNVREPFSESGFYLAPMVVGFPHFFFPFYKNW
ncbi:MAG TPA: 3'-5' exonuclease, partial [Verrucomicrobiae bacterium]|nr:3'-5' exonuclease [Verrucomicrobiae bacterium]